MFCQRRRFIFFLSFVYSFPRSLREENYPDGPGHHGKLPLYQPVESHLRQHKNFILEHCLTESNEETIKTKKIQHCSEPCPVVCKKLFGEYKKDYEPYHVLGHQVGIFDQRAAELLNDCVDAIGL